MEVLPLEGLSSPGTPPLVLDMGWPEAPLTEARVARADGVQGLGQDDA